MTKQQLEDKYGITIVRDDEFLPGVYEYKMYSADGCPWENGLRSLQAVENECKLWESALLGIKQSVESEKH